MSRYIEYNWPETKFARQNTIGQQIAHVLSEAEEVKEAVEISNDETLLELADLNHSLETLWRNLSRIYGPESVEALFDRIEEKNRGRGYYVEGEEQ